MSRSWTWPAAMLLAGTVAGFVGAQWLEPGSNDSRAPGGEADAAFPGSVPWQTPRHDSSSERYARQDAGPPSTLAALLELDSDFAQTAALYELLDDADVATVERLIEEAGSIGHFSDRMAALSILYARYADLDPEAAFAYFRDRGDGRSDVEIQALFHAWARKDLAGAVAAAEGLSASLRETAGTAILMARSDLPGARQTEIAERLELGRVLTAIAERRALDEAFRDPQSAWQEALAVGDERMLQRRLAGVARGWARHDPMAALNAIAALTDESLKVQLRTQVAYEWSRQDPQAAVNWALSQDESKARRQYTTMALAALAEQQPGLAFEMARGLPDGERDSAVGRVLSRWANDDPLAAARALEAVADRDVRRGAIQNVLVAYARQDAQGALQWMSRLDPEETRSAAHLMFQVLGREDPARAGGLINRLGDPQSRAMAVQAVAGAWAREDPQAAARWVGSLTEPALRVQASTTLAAHWGRQDVDAALGFAESLSDTAEREAALVGVIRSAPNDVELAERLLRRLTLDRHRRAAAGQLYFRLRESDPQRAEEYRAMAGIDEQPRVIRR